MKHTFKSFAKFSRETMASLLEVGSEYGFVLLNGDSGEPVLMRVRDLAIPARNRQQTMKDMVLDHTLIVIPINPIDIMNHAKRLMGAGRNGVSVHLDSNGSVYAGRVHAKSATVRLDADPGCYMLAIEFLADAIDKRVALTKAG